MPGIFRVELQKEVTVDGNGQLTLECQDQIAEIATELDAEFSITVSSDELVDEDGRKLLFLWSFDLKYCLIRMEIINLMRRKF